MQAKGTAHIRCASATSTHTFSLRTPLETPLAHRFEAATVLLSMPEGKPAVAAPKDFDWNKVLDDVDHVLHKNETSEHTRVMAEWRQFTDARSAHSHAGLPKWDFKTVPGDATGPVDARSIARRAVEQSAIVVRQPQTIASSVSDGAEGRSARQARNTANEGLGAALGALKTGSWAMVAVEYAADAGGCQIPRILVQLPDDFGGVDTTRPDAKFDVKWWEPKPPDGKYDGSWRKWNNGRAQYVSQVSRDMVTLTNVKFTRDAELQGGFRKLNGETKRRLQSDAGAKYAEFSSSAASA